jgi:RNA polymerase sigma-70 factor, ECF subfamily
MAAFESLMLAHERQVLRVALRLLGNLEDAQDAAQEVFFRLYRHLGRIDAERVLAAWLYRVTVNVCRDLLRKRHPGGPLEDLPASPVDASAGERRRMLHESLKILGEKERAALVLREIEGLETSEVAAILGCSETTVRSQVSTAKAKITSFIQRWTARRES